MKKIIIAIAACISASQALADLSNEEFSKQVQEQKAAMHADKGVAAKAKPVCSNLSQERFMKEPQCIALQKYESEKLSKFVKVEW